MSWILSGFADEADPQIDRQIQVMLDLGLRHIDLRMVDGWNISVLPVDHAKEVKVKLDRAGLAVTTFGSPIGKIDIREDFQIDLGKLDHLAKLAEVFDCRAVRLFSYFNGTNQPMAQWRATAIDRMGKLKRRAEQFGLALYHENEHLIFGDLCEHVLAIAEALWDGKHFRLIFDFDNYNQSGESDVWEVWRRLKSRTDSFHLKDSTKNCMNVPVGHGAGCVEKILRDALASGWQGVLSLEPHLARSQAVLATGPGGRRDAALEDLNPVQAFNVGGNEAIKLLNNIGAEFE